MCISIKLINVMIKLEITIARYIILRTKRLIVNKKSETAYIQMEFIV